MAQIYYPLSVLARAVAFKNLSAASQHVGLSQPQLSRLVMKLESEVGLRLLDRSVKRKASWTADALHLAHAYEQNRRRLDRSILAMQENRRTRELHIGTLEGLIPAALHMTHRLLEEGELHLTSLDVFDRNELEAKFLAGDL